MVGIDSLPRFQNHVTTSSLAEDVTEFPCYTVTHLKIGITTATTNNNV